MDVVPSHWYDNLAYQSSGLERDRSVTILNKKVPETIHNLPFLHIHKINERNILARDGLKKAIRLCKNVKNDANEEGREINFSSFDIAAAMWHSDITALSYGVFYELAILAETQRFLDELYHNPTKAKALVVPDGSRCVFDTEEKYNGLKALSSEMDDLAKEVAKEHNLLLSLRTELTLSDVRDALSKAIVPAA